MAGQPVNTPYGDAALTYLDLGWLGPLPMPVGEGAKTFPPTGFTGKKGVWPTTGEIRKWAFFENKVCNISIRLPHGMVGLDVDAHSGKGGGESLAELTAKLGPLPETFRFSARTDGVSGIYIFRAELPEGRKWREKNAGRGIEIVHFGHRYAMAPPSIHPRLDVPYLTKVGEKTLDRLPTPEEAAEMPPEWIEALTAPRGPEASENVTEIPPKFTEGQELGTRYGLVGMRRELREMRQVWDDNKEAFNPKFNDTCFAIGQLVGGGHLDADHAREMIEETMRDLGVPDSQYRTLDSGFTAGVAQPREKDIPTEEDWDPADEIPADAAATKGEPNVTKADRAFPESLKALSGLAKEEFFKQVARYEAANVFQEYLATAEGDPDMFQPINWDDVEEEEDMQLDPAGIGYNQGRVLVFGDAASGKTMLVNWLQLQHVRAGRTVAIYELEMGATKTKKRFNQLGATRDEMSRIKYYQVPDAVNLIEHGSALAEAFRRENADVVMYDSITPLLMECNLDNNLDVEVRRFIKRTSDAIVERGGLVYFIDHTGTGQDAQGRVKGSADKKASVDMMIQVSVDKKNRFKLGTSGKMNLTIRKDRYGIIGQECTMGVRVAARENGNVDLFPLIWEEPGVSAKDKKDSGSEEGTPAAKEPTRIDRIMDILAESGAMTASQIADRLSSVEGKKVTSGTVRSTLDRYRDKIEVIATITPNMFTIKK